MQVDLRLSNATVYDVSKFDVVEGEEFSLTLLGWADPARWVAENDPVLAIVVTGTEAKVSALSEGESIIYILEKTAPGEQLKTIKELYVKVVAEIIPPAVALNLAVGEEVLK